MFCIYDIKNDEIVGSVFGIARFVEWLCNNKYSSFDIRYKKMDFNLVESSNLEDGYYIIDDEVTKIKTVVKLEKVVSEGYIYNSTSYNTTILGEWKLIPKNCGKKGYLRMTNVGLFMGNFESKKLSDMNDVISLHDCTSLDIFKKFQFNNLETIIFHDNFNEKIMPGDIPIGVKRIRFGYYYNQNFIREVIPNTVRKVVFGNHFNQELKPGDIPNSVRIIKFGQSFNQELKAGSIPNSVHNIEFGSYYDKVFTEESFPDSVTTLIIGNKMYNRDLYVPKSVEYLSICSYFREDISKEVIPKNVTKLTLKPLGCNSNSIPEFITDITIKQMAKCKLDLPEFPNSIRRLFLILKNAKFTKEMIPKNVKKLVISSSYDLDMTVDDIPKNISYVRIRSNNNVILEKGNYA